MSGGPHEGREALTVVVVCFNAPDILERCARALEEHVPAGAAELAFVGRWDSPDAEWGDVQARHSRISWVTAPAEATIPQMRALGIRRSTGRTIALLEDDCIVTPGWHGALEAPIEAPCGAIGGPIEPGPYRVGRDWAVFFCEYGRFASPFAGDVAFLPGNNVAYRREVLVDLLERQPSGGFYEVRAHAELRAKGYTLSARPSMAVHNVNHWHRDHLWKIPFHHGRGFAAMRVEGAGVVRRAFRAAGSALLPLVIIGRVVREALRRKRRRELALALPWVAVFALSWSAGEALGYLRGAGTSLGKWR